MARKKPSDAASKDCAVFTMSRSESLRDFAVASCFPCCASLAKCLPMVFICARRCCSIFQGMSTSNRRSLRLLAAAILRARSPSFTAAFSIAATFDCWILMTFNSTKASHSFPARSFFWSRSSYIFSNPASLASASLIQAISCTVFSCFCTSPCNAWQ